MRDARTGQTDRNRGTRDIFGAVGNWTVPPTVSKPALLPGGSDKPCQRLVYDLLALAQQMEINRNTVAWKFQVTGPQYSILMAIARFQTRGGIGASAVAKLLHVSLAFIIAETSKLIAKGLVLKCRNPQDRREALLAISSKGQLLIEEHSEMIRDMNDMIFGALSPAEFEALTTMVARLVLSSTQTAAELRQRIDADQMPH
jgi:DNA-binding MarR family transcriptional regulator